MKAFVRNCLVMGSLCLLLSLNGRSQLPTGFSYQAVVRSTNGDILPGQAVSFRFSILSGTASGPVVYAETQQTTTTAQGLVSLSIGEGTVVSGDFSQINWPSGNFYLKIEMDPAGGTAYTTMDNKPIQAVPLASFAEKSAGMAPGRIEVAGDETQDPEVALFEVKRNDGQTVFAVYPEGVRVYVEDLNGKGSKGGFAVGGFNPGKGITDEFLRVTPDSTRVYIRNPLKGSKGGFAVGGFNPGKGTVDNFLDLTPENYFIGHEAGISNTDGIYNSFFGYQAGRNNTSGSQNIFIGYKAGFSNTEGFINSFIGNNAGYTNTTGHENVFIGDSSGYFNETGYWNVFVGERTGKNNISGRSNVFVGDKAGQENLTGDVNVFIGSIAGWKNVDGSANVFLGSAAGGDNISGNENTIIGSYAGRRNTLGNTNIFIGRFAGYTNTTGSDNIYIGNRAGALNDTSFSNIFIGNNSGQANLKGLGNVFLGNRSGNENIDGSDNTILGHESGHYHTTGNRNTLVGAYAGHENYTGEANVLLGWGAGQYSGEGNENTFVGTDAGLNATGNRNVFLGLGSGYNEKGSNKLYIENSPADSAGALVYGDFETDVLSVNGKIGINTATPWNDLQVSSRTNTWAKLMVGERDSIVGYSEFAGGRSGSAGGSVRLGTSADFDDNFEYWQVSVWGESFEIGTPLNYAIFEIKGDGSILHRGVQLYADYVFDKGYALESIEDHARSMWANGHLPAVSPLTVDDTGAEVVDLGARNKGVLEELEKAHVYIEQLNERLKAQEEMILELKKEVEALKK